jgi:hypothetical protein
MVLLPIPGALHSCCRSVSPDGYVLHIDHRKSPLYNLVGAVARSPELVAAPWQEQAAHMAQVEVRAAQAEMKLVASLPLELDPDLASVVFAPFVSCLEWFLLP